MKKTGKTPAQKVSKKPSVVRATSASKSEVVSARSVTSKVVPTTQVKSPEIISKTTKSRESVSEAEYLTPDVDVISPEVIDSDDVPIEFDEINPDEDPIAAIAPQFLPKQTSTLKVDLKDVGHNSRKKTKTTKSTLLEKDGVVQGVLTRDESSDEKQSDVNIASEKGLASVDPIVTYLAELRKYPLLTREQEHSLALRYREHGDSKAAETLVTSNLRFVVKVAAEYTKFGAKLIDLVQEGNVGLMHAVREYDPYKNVRLISYAVWWIRGYIQEYLMRQYSMVRIGTTQAQRKLFYRLQKEKEAMDRMGISPTHKLLSSRLGVTEEEVATMDSRMSRRDVSLDQPITGDGTSASTLLDFEASGERALDDALGTAEEVAILQKHIADLRGSLNDKELFILENRLLSDEPMTLQEIGEKFGVTREAVRQVEARLMNRIKTKLSDEI